MSVQLIDLELKSSGNASLGGPTVLEEQILLLSDEAVFEFAPISSRTNSKSLLIEVRLFLSLCHTGRQAVGLNTPTFFVCLKTLCLI